MFKSMRLSSNTSLKDQEENNSMNNKSFQFKIWIIASRII